MTKIYSQTLIWPLPCTMQELPRSYSPAEWQNAIEKLGGSNSHSGKTFPHECCPRRLSIQTRSRWGCLAEQEKEVRDGSTVLARSLRKCAAQGLAMSAQPSSCCQFCWRIAIHSIRTWKVGKISAITYRCLKELDWKSVSKKWPEALTEKISKYFII